MIAYEVERALLAGLMGPAHLRSRTKPSDLDNLHPSDFYREGHAKLFGLLQDLEAEGLPPVDTVLRQRAQALGLFEAHSECTPTAIISLCEMPAPGDIAHLARLVREASIAREVAQDLRGLQELLDVGKLGEVRDRLLQIADTVAMSERTGARDSVTVADAAEAKALERMRSVEDPSASGSQLPSGLDALDAAIRLERGQFVAIGGRPGMGKSALALGIALANATPDRGSIVFSLEMQEWELAFRATGILREIEVSHLIGGILGHNWPAAQAGFQLFRERAIWIDDRPSHTIESIWGEARKIKGQHPTLSMVVVDHVGLVRATNPRETREVAKLQHITNACKRMAKDLDVCVIGLAQLNRGVESRDNKRPMMMDFRDSGSYEQDADIVIGMYRDGYYHKNQDQTIGEAINLKQRNAEANATAFLRWDGPSICYRDPPRRRH